MSIQHSSMTREINTRNIREEDMGIDNLKTNYTLILEPQHLQHMCARLILELTVRYTKSGSSERSRNRGTDELQS